VAIIDGNDLYEEILFVFEYQVEVHQLGEPEGIIGGFITGKDGQLHNQRILNP